MIKFTLADRRAYARAIWDALVRLPALPRVGRAVVQALVRRSVHRLRAHPAVREVLLRGSYAGSGFVPLASDVDLVIRLREPDGPSYASVVSVLHALRRVRRRDPSIRDEWQMLVGDTEWPLLERYGSLFDADRWCDEMGRREARSTGTVAPRLHHAHAWRRQNTWTHDAMRLAFPGPSRSRDDLAFAAAEKKTHTLAALLAESDPPARRAQPPRSDRERVERVAALLAARDASATRLVRELGAPLPPLPHPHAAASDPRILEAAQTALRGLLQPTALVAHAGSVIFVFAEAVEADGWRVRLDALLALQSHVDVRVTAHSLPSFALEASTLPMRFLLVDSPGDAVEWQPLLLPEQLFTEALLIGADVRILADRSPPAAGPPFVTERLVRLLAYLSEGRLVREREAAFAALGDRDPTLAALVAAGPHTAEEWFWVNVRLFTRLVTTLGELHAAGQGQRITLPRSAS